MHTRTPLNQLGRKLFQLFSLVPIVTLAEPRSSVELPPPPPPRNFEGIKTAFKRHKIIPDLLSIAPKYTLEVSNFQSIIIIYDQLGGEDTFGPYRERGKVTK